MSTTFMHELNDGVGATVDARMVPLVKFLNRLSVKTVSSYVDAEFASVSFTGKDPKQMSDLLFNHIKSMTDHLEGVYLELTFNSKIGCRGEIEMPVECLDDVSTRVGCWLEMMAK